MDVQLLGDVKDIEPIAANLSIRERHWYEAHGVGRRKMKVKRVLD